MRCLCATEGRDYSPPSAAAILPLLNDPDILNMLAYTQRKTGELDRAIDNYKRALDLRPDFPQAREYLGEAYLQAALAQLKWLDDKGTGAERERDQLLRKVHEATQWLDAPPAEQEASRW